MAANNDPIYSKAPDVQWIGYMVTANTTADLTAGTSYLAFTADATNGGYLQKLRFKATPAGNTTATVARVWINNGATTGTAANNTLFDEVTLPAITASTTQANISFEIPMNIALPATYRVYLTIHTASANGWAVTAIGGKY
jgi:hypothetical protein